MAAHPRVGGENQLLVARALAGAGSSPRGRGKPSRRRLPFRSSGLIPAWAGKTSSSLRGRSRVRAHPRVGGENRRGGGSRSGHPGSSPRGRGKRPRARQRRRPPGLIPAWAGKTASHARSDPGRPAHPRVGGENEIGCGVAFAACGSSPRGRGKPNTCTQRIPTHRLIPAWAGKTTVGVIKVVKRVAHPRVGGENRRPVPVATRTRGSSPRGRGKPSGHGPRGGGRGLIPAWAGKTRQMPSRSCANRAHPRVGGENKTCLRASVDTAGSSPRGRGKRDASQVTQTTGPAHPRVGGENNPRRHQVRARVGSSPRGRGKHDTRVRRKAEQGLIPAWAGKTRAGHLPHAGCGAHPRVGGENAGGGGLGSHDLGSSPRGRGKRDRGSAGPRAAGLIPAWAGKTVIVHKRCTCCTAHPRVGGENTATGVPARRRRGSSPRGRGKPGCEQGWHFLNRLIPAWAGKT